MSETPKLRLAHESIAGTRPYQEDAVLADALVEALTEGQDLEAAFLLANERIQAEATEPGKEGMGTTLVAMLLDGDSYHIANVGDSRTYLLSCEEAEASLAAIAAAGTLSCRNSSLGAAGIGRQPASSTAAWAAARRATGTRKGEQLT